MIANILYKVQLIMSILKLVQYNLYENFNHSLNTMNNFTFNIS